MTSEINKRIAKNTLMLYFRMLLSMGISLYTVRVVLNTLGVVDYGIYNVVGGVVTMFSFLSGTMASASQRFFAFELGRRNYEQLKKTFSMTITIYVMIAVIILILAETVGLWFLNTQMTIPAERMGATNWIYQFSILSFMMTMFTVPYNAAIIAHERMNVYAYVSIIEVSLKLLIVYLLVIFSFDKLKLYSVLTFTVTTFVTLIYRTYCKRKFEECRFSFFWEKKLFKEILGFSGWNLFGSLSQISRNQGIDVILNIFFNPAINAAKALALQINNAILNFSNGFYTAVRPQIIKSYAANDNKELQNLVFMSTKFSYFLLFFLAFPFLITPSFILNIWLNKVPEYTPIFIRLIIIDMLIEATSNLVVTLAQAAGKIKLYQLVVGLSKMMIIPMGFLILENYNKPELIFYVMIGITIICNVSRIQIVSKIVAFDVKQYYRNIFSVLVLISLISYGGTVLLITYLKITNPILSILIGLIIYSILITRIGLSKYEKNAIKNFIKNKFKRI